jgi:bifunctional DNA-binding transcriptional regulator/antitoxin component of YhaV-PrlF toxin-antitoxin module
MESKVKAKRVKRLENGVLEVVDAARVGPLPKTATATRRGRTSTSAVSSKNQVTIPIEVMRQAGICVGDLLQFTCTENGEILISQSRPKILNLLGFAEGLYRNYDLAAERNDAWGE